MPSVSSSRPMGIGAVSSQLSQATVCGNWTNSSSVSIHQEKKMQASPSASSRVTRPAGRLCSSMINQTSASTAEPPSPATSIQSICAQFFSSPVAR